MVLDSLSYRWSAYLQRDFVVLIPGQSQTNTCGRKIKKFC